MNGKSNMQSEPGETLLLNYLLGNLSEEEQAQVEDRAFADAGYLAALEAAEADLVDTYVRGGLSQSERRAFEARFLTSANRRSKVEFARALARVTPEPTGQELAAPRLRFIRGRSPALKFAVAFATLVCIAGSSWLIFQNAAMRSRIGELERAQAPRQQSPAQQQPPAIASLVLLPGVSRSETQIKQLVISPSAQIARIEIQLEARDDFPRFLVELRTSRGEDVLTLSNLPRSRSSAGDALSFDVPASALAAGEYELSLKGLSGNRPAVEIGYYYFSVKK
jgi:hypothetical protein